MAPRLRPPPSWHAVAARAQASSSMADEGDGACLAIILERVADEALQRIAACRDAAYGENVPLLRWADAVRSRAA